VLPRLLADTPRRGGERTDRAAPASGSRVPPQGQPAEPALGATAGGLRILVVDDEPSMRMLCRINLSLAGFEVVEAADGDAALAVAADGFDLVLLDVMLPGLSGFEIAARLRADPRTKALPIVFLSARADRQEIERGRALGALEYITKPFDPLALPERLASLLRDGADP
jgi:DNA-binding response OmpR family regulator